MEENLEVVMDQEMPSAEEQTMLSPDGEGGTERSSAIEVTDEVLANEAEIAVEETVVPEANAEDAAGDVDGSDSQEQVFPEIDPQVFAGWQELAKAHPEVVGKPLPDDIMKACVESGLPPLRVYESMMLVKQGEQIAALQQEIATLRQNAEAAQRAPVTAASFGGDAGYDPNDPFMKDFDSYYSGK